MAQRRSRLGGVVAPQEENRTDVYVETAHLAELLYLHQVVGHVDYVRRHTQPLVSEDQHALLGELELLEGHRPSCLLKGHYAVASLLLDAQIAQHILFLDFDDAGVGLLVVYLLALAVLEDD